MSPLLTLLGTGNAFSEGGRTHSCFLLEHDGARLLVECGGSAPPAVKRMAPDVDDLDGVIFTHFHGDHFGGIPYLLSDMEVHKRRRPLHLAGPPGVKAHVRAAMEALYPGFGEKRLPFEVVWTEHDDDAAEVAGVTVEAFPVKHSPASLPHALRVHMAGRTLAFSGDTRWTETLLEVARDANVFICECSGMSPIPGHLDYPTLLARRADLTCQRLILTHMGADVLRQDEGFELERGRDGMVIEFP